MKYQWQGYGEMGVGSLSGCILGQFQQELVDVPTQEMWRPGDDVVPVALAFTRDSSDLPVLLLDCSCNI